MSCEFRIIAGVTSDMVGLRENSVLLHPNPVEVIQLAKSARRYLSTADSKSGETRLGYQFDMTPCNYALEGRCLEEPPEDFDPPSGWRLYGEKLVVTPTKIMAFAWVKNTRSYFMSDNLEPLLVELADRQLRERQCGS